jgi:hypothetical protein
MMGMTEKCLNLYRRVSFTEPQVIAGPTASAPRLPNVGHQAAGGSLNKFKGQKVASGKVAMASKDEDEDDESLLALLESKLSGASAKE